MKYRLNPGPYCIIFYQQNNQESKQIYINLIKFLKDFPDLPFLRAGYKNFKLYNPNEKLTSPNKILIIEDGKESKILEVKEYDKIPQILTNVRIAILCKKRRNANGLERVWTRIWTPKSRGFKYNDIKKFIILMLKFYMNFRI